MQKEIMNTIMTKLNSNWVCDETVYPWREDFLDTLFLNRYYYLYECLDVIDNDAQTYMGIIKKVVKHYSNIMEVDITNPLELFNLYYYILAHDMLYNDNNVQDRIHEIRRIQQMNYLVPLVLNTIPIHPVRSTIMTYISSEY